MDGTQPRHLFRQVLRPAFVTNFQTDPIEAEILKPLQRKTLVRVRILHPTADGLSGIERRTPGSFKL